MVWQARVTRNTPPNHLILVPHSEALSLQDNDSKAWKRPRHLHPALQANAIAKVLPDEESVDFSVFEMRSPLLGKGGLSPPAYWAVLAVKGEGNMCFKETTVPLEYPQLVVKGCKKKPNKKGLVQASINHAAFHTCDAG